MARADSRGTALATDFLDEFGIRAPEKPHFGYDRAVDFIEAEMYIEVGGDAVLMTLEPEQVAVINYMTQRDAMGKYRFSMWIYSSIKKSAKTTIAAALVLWASWGRGNGHSYVVGNDKEQANTRLMAAILFCMKNNPRMQDRYTRVKDNITLDNGTEIHAVAVDGAGEAGAKPICIALTEAWGATDAKHETMFAEMALSPTDWGDSFQLVESYAGMRGISRVLERLYEMSVQPEYRLHIPECPEAELYQVGSTICYWNTRRFLSWQRDNPGYYAQMQMQMLPTDFARQHLNEWSSSSDAFVPDLWWHGCKAVLKPLSKYDSCTLGIDAAVTGDCFGIVMVSKRVEAIGMTPEERGRRQPIYQDVIEVRGVWKWQAKPGTSIKFSNPADPNDIDTPEGIIRWLSEEYNITEAAYDPYQMHDLATRLQNVVPFMPFQQNTPRLVSDKKLRDLIRERRIEYGDGCEDLTEHILNANAKTDGERLRLVKRNEALKIDLAVALSMAADRISVTISS